MSFEPASTQNAGKNGPDAGRPSEPERHPDQDRTDERLRFRACLYPFLGLEERNPEDAHRVETEDDHERAGDLAENARVAEEELADGARRGAERDENEREAENERERLDDDLPPRGARRVILHLFERHA